MRFVTIIALALLATAQTALGSDPPEDPLQALSASVQTLVKHVAPSVVQVLVTGYGPVDDSPEHDTTLAIGKQRVMGSGAVVDSEGWILTNAHVVSGAQRIQVVLSDGTSNDPPFRSLTTARGRTVDAQLVGVAREVDLALLKADVRGAPAIPIADYAALRQGELVFAFGSPEGLRDSVTMGVVSAVARQPDPDRPMVYVQTDAPINHGNSGGPLVNVRGELVGINTFILSDSGGSQGLGFAIPSAVVRVAYQQLRQYGHLHRSEIGINVQGITPDLARALGLAQDHGVIVSDALPDGPADTAGLKVGDIILSVDGRRVDSVPLLAFHLYTKKAGEMVGLAVLRGTEQLMLSVRVIERSDDLDRLADLVNPDKSRVEQLGILGLDLDAQARKMLPVLRIDSGVVVAARTADPRAADVSLAPGDVIHAVNATRVSNLLVLRAVLDSLEPRSPVVLQIEREGRLLFLTFELD